MSKRLDTIAENFVRRVSYAAKRDNMSGAFHNLGERCYSYARLLFTHSSHDGILQLTFHPGRTSLTTNKHINAVRRMAARHGFRIVEG